MAKVITYGCKECGCEIIVSGSHEAHLRPIYCCGVEVKKISSSSKKTVTKKTTPKKATKTVKKATTKKKTGTKPVAKKTAARKKTSKK